MNTRRTGDPPLLSVLGLPSMYFGGHDDCCFYAESRDDRLPLRIMSRLVAVLAGATLLKEATGDVTLAEPDEHLASRLFDQSDTWVGTGRVEDADVVIELTPSEWRLGQAIPHDPSVSVRLAADRESWSVEGAP